MHADRSGPDPDPRRPPPTDYDAMAARYRRGRDLRPERLQDWRVAIGTHLVGVGPGLLLDVGSGTGIWSNALARWFGRRVVALEPSAGMRSEARAARVHPLVALIGGRAEAIPLRSDSVAAALLSTVVHHIDDVPAAAAELHRVLRSGGPVLIRSAFVGRTDGVTWLRYFPEAKALAEARWPDVHGVVHRFRDAGFAFEHLQSVPQESASDLREYRERIRTRADSTLAILDDELFARGLAALDEAVEQPGADAPVIDRLDLLVLRRR